MIPTCMPQAGQSDQDQSADQGSLKKMIHNNKDVIHFNTHSPAYKNLTHFVELLSERIRGTQNKFLNSKYKIENETFQKCAQFFDSLSTCCDETDLKTPTGPSTLRFGHLAFRDWCDKMGEMSKEFIDDIASSVTDEYREELYVYLTDSFGNRMRIDYGTGHELNFIIFLMGLSNLTIPYNGDEKSLVITTNKLHNFVVDHGWDLHALFAHKYLRICRKLQTKFRLEPAGSRGVYNVDDFQFLPFQFGAAQLAGSKSVPSSDFYDSDRVLMLRDDYVFFEAIEFILSNKKGPFNEHSYTLWGFTSIGSWDGIYRRIKLKFKDDILGPITTIQHISFGKYILLWDKDK